MDLMPINGVEVLNISSRITSAGMVFAILYGAIGIIVLSLLVFGMWDNWFSWKDITVISIGVCVCVFLCMYGISKREPLYQITITEEAKATEVLEHYEIMNIDGKIITVREIGTDAKK